MKNIVLKFLMMVFRLKPYRTFENVAREIVEGLEDGSVTLR
jgi:hypothetical protein